MRTASEYRAMARAQMDNGIFTNKWMMLLVAGIVYSAIYNAASMTGFLALIVAGPLGLGYAAVFLKRVRASETPVNLEDMTESFKNGRLGGTVVLGLLHTLYIALWTLLFVILGIVKSYSYAMVYYISLDRPELDANQCITESRRIMNGHKWDLFCLDLSFIGWYIVGLLCCGIGTLWVAPYRELSRANFYEDLCRKEMGYTVV